ncbi:DEAD-box helicase Dbp80 [Trichonephila clavipes]|nr:DEAD-box helicase Dbp80 [Trichonephila clavipes]
MRTKRPTVSQNSNSDKRNLEVQHAADVPKMADDDWGLSADLQEKNLAALNNLSLNRPPIPPPVPASQYIPQQNDDDDEPEPNPADISLMMKLSFEELNLRPELLKGVYAMGFNSPSKIQETALPILIADPPLNMIAQSQSGTGKTAAFILAALSRVNPNLKYPHVLVLAPTYELAVQTGKVK